MTSMSDVSPARIGLLIDYLDDEGGFDENILPVAATRRRRVRRAAASSSGRSSSSSAPCKDCPTAPSAPSAMPSTSWWTRVRLSSSGRGCPRTVSALRPICRGRSPRSPASRWERPKRCWGSGCSGFPPARWRKSRSSWRPSPRSTAAASVGIAFEDSLIGNEYLRTTRVACKDAGLRITAEVPIPQVAGREARRRWRSLAADKPDGILHVGFGLGIPGMNDALEAIGWMPPALHDDGLRVRRDERVVAQTARRVDRPRPVRRAQRDGPGVPRQVRSPPRPAARVLLSACTATTSGE